MPTIQDVADQVNAKLDQINQNTANEVAISNQIKNEIAVTNNELNTIENTLNAGFSNISQGLFLVTELQKIQIDYLNYMRQQNDTIICLLTNNNEMLCGMTRKLTTLIGLDSRTLALVDKIEGIGERVHAAEAEDYDRLGAIKARMDECCPPAPVPVEPCPPACPQPAFRIPDPKGTDWTPLPAPRDQKGVG